VVWDVILADEFQAEFLALSEEVRIGLVAGIRLLEIYGPRLSRPHADTLKGSKFVNMKELRFRAEDGVWRVAFAFDPKRKAVVLVAGDKRGVNETRFYKGLIAIADARYEQHLLRVGLRR
jgi:hypothetical protein